MREQCLLNNEEEFKIMRFKMPTSAQQSKDDQPEVTYYVAIGIDRRIGLTFNNSNSDVFGGKVLDDAKVIQSNAKLLCTNNTVYVA